MLFIKLIIILLVFLISTIIGFIISNRYKLRVNDLKEFQSSINILESKINFTYEPLPEIFKEMSEILKFNIGQVYKIAGEKMKQMSAKEAWEEALIKTEHNLNNDDVEILKSIGKTLGQTDKRGQISALELTKTFLSSQIEKAEKEEQKNSKMYKSLGGICGALLTIILI